MPTLQSVVGIRFLRLKRFDSVCRFFGVGESGLAAKLASPASVIAGSKVGKQLAADSQSMTQDIRNIGVIAHIDAGKWVEYV